MNTQISLFQEKGAVVEIKKHSGLTQMKNTVTLQQRKCMNTFIWIAKNILNSVPNQRRFRIDFSTLKRHSGIKSISNEQLKDALRGLADKKIEYNILGKDKKEWGIFNFLSEAKITNYGRGKEGYIEFELPTTVIEAIKFPNIYTKLDLCLIRGLNSKYSLALYELLKDYQDIEKIKLTIEKFRELMGVEDGKYLIITMLKERIVDTAVEEINEKTDLNINYELIKTGKKISDIYFYINQKKSIKKGLLTDILLLDYSKGLAKALLDLGFDNKQIDELFSKYDEEYIKGNVDAILPDYQAGKIKKVVPYLIKAFEKDYRPIKTEYTKKIENDKKEKQEKEKQNEELMKKNEKYDKEKQDKQNKLIDEFLGKCDIDDIKLKFLEYIRENQKYIYNMWEKDENQDINSKLYKPFFRKYILENLVKEV